jgi:hypothetical protein
MKWQIDIEPVDVAPVRDLVVTLDETVFRLVLTWRERPACWYLDLYDAADVAMLKGHALRPDRPALYRRRGAPWPAGRLVLYDTSGAEQECTLAGLGRTHQLLYLDADEIDAAVVAASSVLTVETP